MLLHPIPALQIPFPRNAIIKGNNNNGRNPSSCSFPDIGFINEEVKGYINEEVMCAINKVAKATGSVAA